MLAPSAKRFHRKTPPLIHDSQIRVSEDEDDEEAMCWKKKLLKLLLFFFFSVTVKINGCGWAQSSCRDLRPLNNVFVRSMLVSNLQPTEDRDAPWKHRWWTGLTWTQADSDLCEDVWVNIGHLATNRKESGECFWPHSLVIRWWSGATSWCLGY